MKRRLFYAGAVISLVLCLAVAALWVRSYWSADVLSINTRRFEGVSLSFRQGGLLVLDDVVGPIQRLEIRYEARDPYEFDAANMCRWHGAGFGWIYEGAAPHGVLIPLWSIWLVLAIMPGGYLWRWARRRNAGLCPACGYDLRGTPGSACPECGAPIISNPNERLSLEPHRRTG